MSAIEKCKKAKDIMFKSWEEWASEQDNRVIARRIRAGICAVVAVLSYGMGKGINSNNDDKHHEKKPSIIIEQESEQITVKHTVLTGESLTKIAKKYGVTVDAILNANPNITNPDIIQPNDTIVILNPTIIPTFDNQESHHQNNVGVKLPDGFEQGIDFSSYAGDIDWDKLEDSYRRGEYSYIILRMAENYSGDEYKFALDSKFEKNLEECNKRGIPYGAYIFTRGDNVESIKKQANATIGYIETLKKGE